MAKKVDGVIEAVRYKNGQIASVRLFERRGTTFSDRVVLDRKALLEQIQQGRQFVTGSREELLASTFKLAKPLILVKANEREFIATREGIERDELENVPFF
ncbi:MAG TPA: hypothetical protein PKL78_02505 [Anaerolineales bacterium]|nr:hypothetical protein [Anaerolineales bacterium]HNN12400.1 hypothetical protein [Anaerolineales bacterium]